MLVRGIVVFIAEASLAMATYFSTRSFSSGVAVTLLFKIDNIFSRASPVIDTEIPAGLAHMLPILFPVMAHVMVPGFIPWQLNTVYINHQPELPIKMPGFLLTRVPPKNRLFKFVYFRMHAGMRLMLLFPDSGL